MENQGVQVFKHWKVIHFNTFYMNKRNIVISFR